MIKYFKCENPYYGNTDYTVREREDVSIAPIFDAYTFNSIFDINPMVSRGECEGAGDSNEIDVSELIAMDKYLTCDEMHDMYADFTIQNTFTTLCLNIRSLSNARNFAKFEILIDSLKNKPDVIGVCETWLREDQTGPYMSVDGYNFIHNSRLTNNFLSKSLGGGVGLYIRTGLKYDERPDLCVMNSLIETIGIDITLNQQKVTKLNG